MYSSDSVHREQIRQAFETKPDLKGIIHGKRQIINGNPELVIRSFKSKKAGGCLLLEGGLEAAAALCLESSSIVSRYLTQMIEVQISANQRLILDFIVERVDGSYLVIEIKPSIRGLSQDNLDRYKRCAKILNQEGIEFRLIDQYQLPSKQEMYRLYTLYTRGHQKEYLTGITQHARKILIKNSISKIEDARKILSTNGFPHQLAEHLLFHKKIKLLDKLWNNNTVEIAA